MQNYAIVVFYSEEDQNWIATVPDLRGCTAHGKTPEDAFKEVLIAKEGWLEVATEEGYKIPEPHYKLQPLSVAS